MRQTLCATYVGCGIRVGWGFLAFVSTRIHKGTVCDARSVSKASFTLGADSVIFLDVSFTFHAIGVFLTSTSIEAH